MCALWCVTSGPSGVPLPVSTASPVVRAASKVGFDTCFAQRFPPVCPVPKEPLVYGLTSRGPGLRRLGVRREPYGGSLGKAPGAGTDYCIRVILWHLSTCLLTGGGCGVIGKGGASAPRSLLLPALLSTCSGHNCRMGGPAHAAHLGVHATGPGVSGYPAFCAAPLWVNTSWGWGVGPQGTHLGRQVLWQVTMTCSVSEHVGPGAVTGSGPGSPSNPAPPAQGGSPSPSPACPPAPPRKLWAPAESKLFAGMSTSLLPGDSLILKPPTSTRVPGAELLSLRFLFRVGGERRKAAGSELPRETR